ncbi:hypothetical protein PT2222_170176 [Paraburkholderia tropica]
MTLRISRSVGLPCALWSCCTRIWSADAIDRRLHVGIEVVAIPRCHILHPFDTGRAISRADNFRARGSDGNKNSRRLGNVGTVESCVVPLANHRIAYVLGQCPRAGQELLNANRSSIHDDRPSPVLFGVPCRLQRLATVDRGVQNITYQMPIGFHTTLLLDDVLGDSRFQYCRRWAISRRAIMVIFGGLRCQQFYARCRTSFRGRVPLARIAWCGSR